MAKHKMQSDLDADFKQTGRIMNVRDSSVRLFEWGLGNPTGTPASKYYIRLDDTSGSQTLWVNVNAAWKALSVGTVTENTVSKTAAYTVTTADKFILADATTAAFTITLPAASASTGRRFSIKRKNAGANAVTVAAAGADLIDGAATYVMSSQYVSVDLVCDGTAWYLT